MKKSKIKQLKYIDEWIDESFVFACNEKSYD